MQEDKEIARKNFEEILGVIPPEEGKKLHMKMFDETTRHGTLDLVYHVLDACESDFLGDYRVGNFVFKSIEIVRRSLSLEELTKLVSVLIQKNLCSNAKFMSYSQIMRSYMFLHEELQFKSGKQRTELNNRVTAAAKVLDEEVYCLLKRCVISPTVKVSRPNLASIHNCDMLIDAFNSEKWAKEFQILIKSGTKAEELKEAHLQKENADPGAPAAKRQKVG